MRTRENCKQERHKRRPRWPWWTLGLGSLIWLLLRSGTKPRRLVYPCQQAALVNSAGLLGYLASLAGAVGLRHLLKRGGNLARAASLVVVLVLGLSMSGGQPTAPVRAQVSDLPGWTSPTAVSDVYVVENIPEPECSLGEGALPGSAPCNDASYALRDVGVDGLIDEMEAGLEETMEIGGQLLDAERIEPGEYEVILSPGIAGLLAHESFGHGVEMDMFVKGRAKAAEYLGTAVASPMVSLRDGARAAEQTGSRSLRVVSAIGAFGRGEGRGE